MRLNKKVLAAVILAAGLANAPARADVIYDLVLTGYDHASGSPQWGPIRDFSASAQVVVTDQAYADGVSLQRMLGRDSTAQLEGLVGLHAAVTYGGVSLFAGLSDFLVEPPSGSGRYHGINLVIAPGGALSGEIHFNNSETDMRFVFGLGGVSGNTASDAGGGCFGRCVFTGNVVQSVPEPASLALFGAGLLGLGFIRRHRVK